MILSRPNIGAFLGSSCVDLLRLFRLGLRFHVETGREAVRRLRILRGVGQPGSRQRGSRQRGSRPGPAVQHLLGLLLRAPYPTVRSHLLPRLPAANRDV